MLRFFQLFLVSTLLCSFVSCDDEVTEPQILNSPGLEANIGGDRFVADEPSAVLSEILGVSTLTLSGTSDFLGNDPELLQLSLYTVEETAIRAGTYTTTEGCLTADSSHCLLAVHLDNYTGELESAWASSDDDENTPPGALTVELIEVDLRPGGSVQGRFSGTLVNSEGQTRSLTDGKFWLEVQ